MRRGHSSAFVFIAVELAVDFSGKYLYLNEYKGIQGFNIDPTTGALTEGMATLQGAYGQLWLTVVQFPSSAQ